MHSLGHARGRSASETLRMHSLRQRRCIAEPACTVPASMYIAPRLQIPSPRRRREMLAGLQSAVVGASRRRAAPRSQWIGAAVAQRPMSVLCLRRVHHRRGLRYPVPAMRSNGVRPQPREHAWPNRSVEATRNGIGPQSAVVHAAPRGPMPPRAPHLQLQGLPHWVNHAAAVIESRSDSSRNKAALQVTSAVWAGEVVGQGCGLEELQTVIDAASLLQTLMQDAHGGLIR